MKMDRDSISGVKGQESEKVNGYCTAHHLIEGCKCDVISFYLDEPENSVAKGMIERMGIKGMLDSYKDSRDKPELIFQLSVNTELPRCQEGSCPYFKHGLGIVEIERVPTV